MLWHRFPTFIPSLLLSPSGLQGIAERLDITESQTNLWTMQLGLRPRFRVLGTPLLPPIFPST